MKRSDLAKIFYSFNVDGAKLDEVGKHLTTSIANSFTLLMGLAPEVCRDLLHQLNTQISPDVIDKCAAAIEASKEEFIKMQMANLQLGPYLVFTSEESPDLDPDTAAEDIPSVDS